MTYVAQFVKHYGKSQEEDDDVSSQNFDEEILEYEDVMAYLKEAESTLADVHKLFKYRQQDYLKHREFKTEMEKRKTQADILRSKWKEGKTSSLNEDQIDSMGELMEKVDD
jgi:hypothetical protein